jgi:hypothetical protein
LHNLHWEPVECRLGGRSLVTWVMRSCVALWQSLDARESLPARVPAWAQKEPEEVVVVAANADKSYTSTRCGIKSPRHGI